MSFGLFSAVCYQSLAPTWQLQVVLAHLEHLADVSSIKKRRERLLGCGSTVDG